MRGLKCQLSECKTQDIRRILYGCVD